MSTRGRNDRRDDSGGSGDGKPVGDVYAVITDGRRSSETASGKADNWVKVGPCWETKDDGFSFILEAEPYAWRDPRVEKRLVMRRRDTGGR